MANIFLIGFMGSGKTHWGRIWAAKAGLTFYDLDARIEKASRMTIARIFEKKGEMKFRELEWYHLRKFEKKKNFLLACGGGTPCYADNMDWMKRKGEVFYLKATPDAIVDRLTHETLHRPVIKDIRPSELLSFVQHKLMERDSYYLQAHQVLNVTELHENSLAQFLSSQK